MSSITENQMDRGNQEEKEIREQNDTENPVKGETENRTNGGRTKGLSNRGFASMDPEQQRLIASKGGKAAHQLGVAHEFNSEEAREAGRKGGEAVSRDRGHMAQIGRKGGEASRGGGRGNNNKSRETE
jgi:general stress protein YciG